MPPQTTPEALEASTSAPQASGQALGASQPAEPPEEVIEVWTIQLGKWRLAKEKDIALLNITAGSGVQAFAPDFDLVKAYKRGEVPEEAYTEFYHRRMGESRKRFPQLWEQLSEKKRVALACYCKAGVYCHRLLFVPMMKQYLEEKQEPGKHYKVMYQGELTN